MKRIELPIVEIIEEWKSGVNLKELAKKYGISERTIKKKINEYCNNNKKRQYRVLRSASVIAEYLKKGLTPEQIQQTALKSNIIIPDSVMENVISKTEEKNIKSKEGRDE